MSLLTELHLYCHNKVSLFITIFHKSNVYENEYVYTKKVRDLIKLISLTANARIFRLMHDMTCSKCALEKIRFFLKMFKMNNFVVAIRNGEKNE